MNECHKVLTAADQQAEWNPLSYYKLMYCNELGGTQQMLSPLHIIEPINYQQLKTKIPPVETQRIYDTEE